MKVINKRRFAAVIAAAALLLAAVGGTVAYLIVKTDPLVNTFTPADVNVHVTDSVSNGEKSNVVIKNTGTADAYIRARIVGSWVDSSGVVVKAWDPDNDGTFSGLRGAGWSAEDGYYYYTSPVAPGGTTSALFDKYTVKAEVDGAHLVLDVLVQAIQAEGGAAQAAWGWTPTAN